MAMRLKKLIPLLSLAMFPLASYAADSGDTAVSKGKYLATAGDCVACHTTEGGQPFAGGLKMSTPVGDIYSTNITPDKETGIGAYSYDDFAAALRDGVAKDGHHLYPAMPYTSFAKITDEDMHALYDYFMHEVKPVKQQNRDTDISWPLNMRWPLSVWNMVFHDNDVFQPDSSQSDEWNRGAYLVQGLEHCGSCHTPRGIAFQEKALDQNDADYLTGGTLEGWHAPNLTGNMRDGLGSWSADDLATFLKTGQTAHAAAFGSMAEAIENSTQHLTDADLKAMAVYIKSLQPSDSADKTAFVDDDKTAAALTKGDLSQTGAQEYMDNCAACHRIDGKGYTNTYPALAGNTVLFSDDPSSVISVILRGGDTPVTESAVTGMHMPGFAWRLDDKQVADLATFIRNSWGNKASAVTVDQVKEIRELLPVNDQATSDKQ